MEYNNDPNFYNEQEPYANQSQNNNPEPYNDPHTPPPYQQNRQPYQKNSMATASMIMGIISIIGLCCAGFGGIIFGSLALIFGVLSKHSSQPRSSQASVGIASGIIGIVLGFIILIASIVFLLSMSDENHLMEDFYKNLPYGEDYFGDNFYDFYDGFYNNGEFDFDEPAFPNDL